MTLHQFRGRTSTPLSRWHRPLSGLAFAVALGMSATIVSSCSGGDNGGVTIPDPVVSRVEISAPATTLAPGETVQLSAVAKTASGEVVAGTPTWSSSANTIATVSDRGTVTGVAAGTVTITASRGGVSGTLALTVRPAGGTVVTVTVALSDAALPIGDLGQATASARDANNATVTLAARPLTWSSTNTNIATVSATGVISAVGIGTTQIRASVIEGTQTVVGNSTLKVVANPAAQLTADVAMPGLTFSPAEVVVKIGGTVRFIFPNMNHNVIFRPRAAGAPDDIGILANQIVSRKFPTAGVFPYLCTLHNGMVGTVIVSP